MTGVEAKISQDEVTILRDVLHTIATSTSPVACAGSLLQSGRTLVQAEAALFLVFEEPYVRVTEGTLPEAMPPDDLLVTVAHALGTGIHLNPALPVPADTSGWSLPGWMIAPLRTPRGTVGMVMFIFRHPIHEVPELLSLVLDGFAILTGQLRAQARHDKITRNQSEFIRIVSHDLRSPLTSMQGFGSMLESGMVGELNEKQQHFVEKILSGVTQMASLVENIQDAGRYDPENGFYEMERIPCDLTDMIDRIMSNQLLPADKPGLKVIKEVDGDIPIISADVHMLERAITNLVDNAVKYTPDGGQIVVSVHRNGDHLLVGVADNGLGISPENQKLLFERHRRIPREEHKRIKGSGLGLFIVRSVAQRHGGNAWVESAEGRGSTFYISIPIVGLSDASAG